MGDWGLDDVLKNIVTFLLEWLNFKTLTANADMFVEEQKLIHC